MSAAAFLLPHLPSGFRRCHNKHNAVHQAIPKSASGKKCYDVLKGLTEFHEDVDIETLTYVNDGLYIGESAIRLRSGSAGQGVFTSERIEKGAPVLPYLGDITPAKPNVCHLNIHLLLAILNIHFTSLFS